MQNFKGCVIVVSHDRYFMDKVVDHLLVFKGQGDIRDFPGNYSDYRDWREAKEQRDKEAEKPKETVRSYLGCILITTTIKPLLWFANLIKN